MGSLQPKRYEDGRPMLLAGIRRHHTFASVGNDIPRQWDEFVALGALPSQVGTTTYGVICGGDSEAQTMEYMCAAEVRGFDGLYDERFDGATGNGGVEIWLGVKQAV